MGQLIRACGIAAHEVLTDEEIEDSEKERYSAGNTHLRYV